MIENKIIQRMKQKRVWKKHTKSNESIDRQTDRWEERKTVVKLNQTNLTKIQFLNTFIHVLIGCCGCFVCLHIILHCVNRVDFSLFSGTIKHTYTKNAKLVVCGVSVCVWIYMCLC